MVLAETIPLSWTALIAMLSLAGGVPSVLLAWLHLRLNRLHDEHRSELKHIESLVNQEARFREEKLAAVYKHLTLNYTHKETLDARFELLNTSLLTIGERIGELFKVMSTIDDKLDQHTERIVRVEEQDH